MDVDALKWVNDNMGHANGDELLKMMGEAIRQGVDTTSEDGLSEATICQATRVCHPGPVYWHGRARAQLAQQAGQSAVLEFEYTAPDGTKITKTGWSSAMESDKTSKQQMKPSSGTKPSANASGSPRSKGPSLLAWLRSLPKGAS